MSSYFFSWIVGPSCLEEQVGRDLFLSAQTVHLLRAFCSLSYDVDCELDLAATQFPLRCTVNPSLPDPGSFDPSFKLIFSRFLDINKLKKRILFLRLFRSSVCGPLMVRISSLVHSFSGMPRVVCGEPSTKPCARLSSSAVGREAALRCGGIQYKRDDTAHGARPARACPPNSPPRLRPVSAALAFGPSNRSEFILSTIREKLRIVPGTADLLGSTLLICGV